MVTPSIVVSNRVELMHPPVERLKFQQVKEEDEEDEGRVFVQIFFLSTVCLRSTFIPSI